MRISHLFTILLLAVAFLAKAQEKKTSQAAKPSIVIIRGDDIGLHLILRDINGCTTVLH